MWQNAHGWTDPPGFERLHRLEPLRCGTERVEAFRHLLVLIAEHEMEASREIVDWLEAGLENALEQYAAAIHASTRKPSGERRANERSCRRR